MPALSGLTESNIPLDNTVEQVMRNWAKRRDDPTFAPTPQEAADLSSQALGVISALVGMITRAEEETLRAKADRQRIAVEAIHNKHTLAALREIINGGYSED